MSVSQRTLVDTSLERAGVPGIALRGRVVELTVFPAAGGKILDLVHVPSGVNLLWQNRRVPLQPTYAGAPFDDVWCGGWDELFPTDVPCELDGVLYHDHGDLWIGSWEWELERDDGSSAVLYLRRASASVPCVMERWISLERDAPEIRVRYRLRNVGVQPVRFVWNVHVAHAIDGSSRLHLPAGRLEPSPPYAGRAQGAQGVSWPLLDAGAGREHDLSRLPPAESGITELFATLDLHEGWCAVTHRSCGLGLALGFDPGVFPGVWTFGAYGGWRGHHVLLTEPSTGRPGSLADNVASGSAATLDAGAVLETEVVVSVLERIDPEAEAHSFPGTSR